MVSPAAGVVNVQPGRSNVGPGAGRGLVSMPAAVVLSPTSGVSVTTTTAPPPGHPFLPTVADMSDPTSRSSAAPQPQPLNNLYLSGNTNVYSPPTSSKLPEAAEGQGSSGPNSHNASSAHTQQHPQQRDYPPRQDSSSLRACLEREEAVARDVALARDIGRSSAAVEADLKKQERTLKHITDREDRLERREDILESELLRLREELRCMKKSSKSGREVVDEKDDVAAAGPASASSFSIYSRSGAHTNFGRPASFPTRIGQAGSSAVASSCNAGAAAAAAEVINPPTNSTATAGKFKEGSHAEEAPPLMSSGDVVDLVADGAEHTQTQASNGNTGGSGVTAAEMRSLRDELKTATEELRELQRIQSKDPEKENLRERPLSSNSPHQRGGVLISSAPCQPHQSPYPAHNHLLQSPPRIPSSRHQHENSTDPPRNITVNGRRRSWSSQNTNSQSKNEVGGGGVVPIFTDEEGNGSRVLPAAPSVLVPAPLLRGADGQLRTQMLPGVTMTGYSTIDGRPLAHQFVPQVGQQDKGTKSKTAGSKGTTNEESKANNRVPVWSRSTASSRSKQSNRAEAATSTQVNKARHNSHSQASPAPAVGPNKKAKAFEIAYPSTLGGQHLGANLLRQHIHGVDDARAALVGNGLGVAAGGTLLSARAPLSFVPPARGRANSSPPIMEPPILSHSARLIPAGLEERNHTPRSGGLNPPTSARGGGRPSTTTPVVVGNKTTICTSSRTTNNTIRSSKMNTIVAGRVDLLDMNQIVMPLGRGESRNKTSSVAPSSSKRTQSYPAGSSTKVTSSTMLKGAAVGVGRVPTGPGQLQQENAMRLQSTSRIQNSAALSPRFVAGNGMASTARPHGGIEEGTTSMTTLRGRVQSDELKRVQREVEIQDGFRRRVDKDVEKIMAQDDSDF
ncbi:unnamed protein product [Amoebophrya sp. A25]|nr:unnamed protein product [Amoebophrya sp. A25]|eukprot:GSA25T00001557001.1